VRERRDHSGLGLLTPHDVHFGLAAHRLATPANVLATAYAAHPERFLPADPVALAQLHHRVTGPAPSA
jgi:putative transposase